MNKNLKRTGLALAGVGLAYLGYLSLHTSPRPVGNYASVKELVDSIPLTEYSEDIFENWYATRSAILKNEGPCAKKDRHVFVNLNGETLCYIENTRNSLGKNITQENIDEERNIFFTQGITDLVHPDDKNLTSYPFVYSCNSDMYEKGLERVLGIDKDYLLYGSWDGFEVPKEKPISIVEAVYQINDYAGYDLPEDVLKRLLGQLVIESSGRKHAVSNVGARGILQIMPETLDACGIEPRNYEHRFAQVFCALSELTDSYTDLHARIDTVLANYSQETRDEVAAWMTTQAYHAGRGNIAKIFGKDGDVARELNERVSEFKNYSGKDLSLVLITENFGQFSLGPHALIYAVNAEVVGDQLYSR